MQNQTIQILGWYDEENVGDEAFKPSFVKAFASSGFKGRLNFSSSVSDEDGLIVLGGGDVIKSFYLDRIPSRTRIVPMGVGLGYGSEAALLKERQIPFVMVRNKADAAIALEAGLDATYAPDLTFLLETPSPRPLPVQSELKDLAILLTDEINPSYDRTRQGEDNYHEFFKWEIARILNDVQQYYRIHFVPFSTVRNIDDRRVNADIFRRMSKRDNLIFHDTALSVEDARSLIASMDLVVSMKYHGLLFALQAAVPFINIGLTRKTELFCDENGLKRYSIPPYSLTHERFMSQLKIVEDGSTREDITAVRKILRDQAEEGYASACRRFLQMSN